MNNNAIQQAVQQAIQSIKDGMENVARSCVAYCTYTFWRKLKANIWKQQGRYKEMHIRKHRKIFRKRRR